MEKRTNTWIPDYKQTFIYSNNRIETLYAKWDQRKKAYNPVKEKAIYQIGASGITAYASYKKDRLQAISMTRSSKSNLLHLKRGSVR